jgi:hypothetical protein
MLTTEVIKDLPEASGGLSLSAIGHDDMEDLVALYLQVERGWYVVLSTAKHSTPITECVQRNSQGQRAYLQVKSGQTTFDPNVVIPKDVDRFFMFDLVTQQAPAADAKVERIDPSELKDFVQAHTFLLPPYLQRLNF